MNDTSTRSIIIGLFEQLCDSQNAPNSDIPKDVGMHFCVEVTGRNTGFERNENSYHPEWVTDYLSFVHIIVLSGRRVYVAEADCFSMPAAPSYRNTSNHAECWRLDGLNVLSMKISSALDVCRESVPQEHHLPISSYVSLSLTPSLTKPFRMVRVVRDHSNYFDRLERIDVLKSRVVWEDQPNTTGTDELGTLIPALAQLEAGDPKGAIKMLEKRIATLLPKENS